MEYRYVRVSYKYQRRQLVRTLLEQINSVYRVDTEFSEPQTMTRINVLENGSVDIVLPAAIADMFDFTNPENRAETATAFLRQYMIRFYQPALESITGMEVLQETIEPEDIYQKRIDDRMFFSAYYRHKYMATYKDALT